MSEGLPVPQEQVDAALADAQAMREEHDQRVANHIEAQTAFANHDHDKELTDQAIAAVEASNLKLEPGQFLGEGLVKSPSITDRALGEAMNENRAEAKNKWEVSERMGRAVLANITGARREVRGSRQDAYTEAAKQMAEADGKKIDLMTAAPSESNTTAEPKAEAEKLAVTSIPVDEANLNAKKMVARAIKTHEIVEDMRKVWGDDSINAHSWKFDEAENRKMAKKEVAKNLDAYREAARQDAEAHGKTINL